ncbi:unnamed protein product [Sphagnum jensenii]|uniref:urease n=1 Tax=Sphagnum jensenii TaxID=128206 RepID=A0ABP0V576_9BRYO
MRLSPHENDKLSVVIAGSLAQKRLACGIRLNIPEAISLIAAQTLELARIGGYSVSQLMGLGKQYLGFNQVLPGVPDVVDEVQVEAMFLDGSKLVTIHNPICSENASFELTFYGSFLPHPSLETFKTHEEEGLVPGAVHASPGAITLNEGKSLLALRVMNCSDRPIQVGSHYPFIETNPQLCFDRRASYGRRLNIAAGTAVRFEPGEAKTVSLVELGGRRVVRGGNGLCDGPIDTSALPEVWRRLQARGFLDSALTADAGEAAAGLKRRRLDEAVLSRVQSELAAPVAPPGPAYVPRAQYARMFGPTIGDIVRLADTELYIRVERDLTRHGDECKFGGGKVLREGMGQATDVPPTAQLDTLITNALIVDYTGVYKADIGVKDGRIVGIGKAGNPDIMDGVPDHMVFGVNTEAIAGEGLIVTAGGVDSHIHFICPQLCTEALSSGITTLIGGGTGPASGV